MSYRILVLDRRIWTIGPVPADHLGALVAYAEAALGGGKLVIVADIGQHIHASLAICPIDEADAWRRDLGMHEA